MKTKILFVLFTIFALTSCHCVSPDADEESVLIYKPWFFGHGGIDEDPVQTGLTWWLDIKDRVIMHHLTKDAVTKIMTKIANGSFDFKDIKQRYNTNYKVTMWTI